MTRLPPRSTRTDTLFPYTSLFRSAPRNRREEIVGVPAFGRLFALLAADGPARQQSIDPARRDHVSDDRLQGRAAEPEFARRLRSEEHTSELQSLMRISYAVFCLKKKT